MSKIHAFNVILSRLRSLLDDEAIEAISQVRRGAGDPPEAIAAAAGRLRDLANQIPKTGPVLEDGLPLADNTPLFFVGELCTALDMMFYSMVRSYNPPDLAPVDEQHIAWEPGGDASAAAIPCDDGPLESLTNALVCELCGGRLQRIDDIAEYYCPDHQCDWCGEWLNEFGRCQNLDCSRPTDEVWD